MLIIEVSEIIGKYPVYKKGDKIVIDGHEIVLEKTDAMDEEYLYRYKSSKEIIKMRDMGVVIRDDEIENRLRG
ncbi:MAG: hypothetical protein QMD22_02800 [archaeon]|nr:hypothetical protein [archaeon]